MIDNLSNKIIPKYTNFMKNVVELSVKFQRMQLKNPIIIFLLLAVHKLLQVIIPSLSIIDSKSNSMDSQSMKIKQITWIFYFDLINFQTVTQLWFWTVVQIVLSCNILMLVFLLIRTKGKKLRLLLLKCLTLFYYISTFLLVILSQIFSKSLEKAIQSSSTNFTSNLVLNSTELSLFLSVVILFSVVNMILILLLCIFFRLICQTYNPAAQNLLCGRFSLKQIMQDIITKVGVIILVCTSILNIHIFNIFKIVYISTVLLFAFFRLYTQLTYYRYISKVITNINHIIISIQITVLFTTLVTFSIYLPLINSNCLYIMVSLSIFIFKAIDIYFRQYQHKIKLLVFQELRTEQQAVLYFISLNRMIEEVGDNNQVTQKSFYLRNIANVHRNLCLNIDCYCKKNLQKERKFHKLYNLFAEELQNKLSIKYDNCFELKILIMYQKLSIHKNFLHQGVHYDFSYSKISWIAKVILQKYSRSVQIFLSQKQSEYQIAKTEKYSQFQNILKKLKGKIFMMSKLKVQFWNNFNKCGINKEQFESICNTQLKIMRECSQLKQIIWNQYRFHTLINMLITYETCILLSFKPTDQLFKFLERQRQIINSPIYKLQRYEGFMIQKYLQSSLMCCIETSLALNKIGIIVNAFNTQQTFGYAPTTLLNTNISILMPVSMQKQHKLLMENWTKNCSWQNIGHFKQIFCIDSKGQSFSCKIYLKPVQRLGLRSGLADGVNIVGTLIKINTKDYLVVDQKECIIGAGQIFMNLFGISIVGIPLKIICTDTHKITSEVTHGKKTKINTTFYSTKNSQQLFKYYHQKTTQIVDFNSQQLFQKLNQIQKAEPYYFNIQVQLSLYYMGSSKLILLKVISIVKKENMRNKISVQNIQVSPHSFSSSNLSHKSHSSNENFMSVYETQCKHEYSGMKSFSKSLVSNQALVQPSIKSASSTTSSFQSNMHLFQSIFYKGCKIYQKAVNHQKQKQGEAQKKVAIYDIRILRMVGIILGMSIICIVLNSIKLSTNYSGFQEMQDIFFGNGACSDNLQLSMLVYNRALNIYEVIHKLQQSSFINNTQNIYYFEQLQAELRRNKFQFELVHSMIVQEVKLINRQLTDLTQSRIYAYQYLNTTWTKSSGQQIPIMTINFLANFLYSVNKVSVLSIQTSNQLKSFIHSQLFHQMYTHVSLLKNNFPKLYALNNDYLLFYTNMFLSSSQAISLTSYLKLGIIFVLTAAFLLIIFSNIKYRAKQLQNIYTMFRKMQTNIVQVLLVYFRKINQQLDDSESKKMEIQIIQKQNFKVQYSLAEKTKVMQKLHEQTLNSLQNPTDSQITQPNLKFYYSSNLNSILPKLILLLILLIISTINLLMVFAENNIITTTKIMMDDMNALIHSHNILIGSYLQAKGQYTLRDYNKTIASKNLGNIVQKIITDVNITQSAFNQITISALDLFKNYDPSFEQGLINTIIQNVCEHIKKDVQLWQYKQCLQDQKMGIIKLGGAITGFNYFTRAIQQVFLGYLSAQSSSYKLENEFVFPTLDKIIFPLFKINQKIQNLITTSLVIAINSQNIQYLLFMVCEIIIFIGVIVYIRKLYKKQNQESIDRMGRILLMPLRAMRNVSGIMKWFQRISDFKNLRYKNLQ